MKEICAYILYSETLNKYYVGACQESIEERILNHNTSFYGSKTYTTKASDWKLCLKIETQD
jgi:putative endonuclease